MHPLLAAPIKTRHILLSYPLDKRGLLTLFSSNSYARRLSDLIQDSEARVLVLFGDRDEFTSVQNYDTWAALLRETARDGVLQVTCIEDATHFWRPRTMEAMHSVVNKWLSELS